MPPLAIALLPRGDVLALDHVAADVDAHTAGRQLCPRKSPRVAQLRARHLVSSIPRNQLIRHRLRHLRRQLFWAAKSRILHAQRLRDT